MKKHKVVDPLLYARERALEVRAHVPVRSESGYAGSSIGALFALFYGCPSHEGLPNKQARRLVRHYMDACILEVNADFSSAVAGWSRLGNDFLRSFTWDDAGKLTYEPLASLQSSPWRLAIQHLSKLSVDDPIYFEFVKWIYNCHVFLAKLPLTRTDLEAPSLRDWVLTQLSVVDVTQIQTDLLDGLRVAVSYLVGEVDVFPVDALLGKHGPGTTSSGDKTIQEKQIAYNPTIQTREIVLMQNSLRPWVIKEIPSLAKWMVVPKDMKSVRPITAESVEMQHAQQAIKRVIYRATDNCEIMLGKFVTFSDQAPSQRLALQGSKRPIKSSHPITVDLKGASDRLSLHLVINAFSGDLLHYLLCCRSWEVEMPKDLLPKDAPGSIEVRMYAGMGSATTFPVQTIIFTAISLMAVCGSLYEELYGYFPGYDVALSEFLSQMILFGDATIGEYFRNIRIYGDDIIVPELATARLLALLEKFGLQVNRDKSFYGDLAVREACGIFALAGRDITPTRFRVPPYEAGGRADFAVYDALRSLANKAFHDDYRVLYRWALSELRDLKPFVSKDDRLAKHQHCNSEWRIQTDVEASKNRGAKRGKNQWLRVRSELIEFEEPELLFEESRGKLADYIGVVSTRVPNMETGMLFGEPRAIKTAWTQKLKSDSDDLSESYYLDQTLMPGSEWDDDMSNFHGQIPRGTRMLKRIAYLRRFGDKKGWAWAPG